MTTWTEEWPVEKGTYWFYGWRNPQDQEGTNARLYMIDVYLLDGHLTYT